MLFCIREPLSLRNGRLLSMSKQLSLLFMSQPLSLRKDSRSFAAGDTDRRAQFRSKICKYTATVCKQCHGTYVNIL